MLNTNLAQAVIFEKVLINGEIASSTCANRVFRISSGLMYQNNIVNGSGLTCPPSNIAGRYIVIYKGPYATEAQAQAIQNSPISPTLGYPTGFIGGNSVSSPFFGPFPLSPTAPQIALNLSSGYYAIQTLFTKYDVCPTPVNYVAGEGGAIILRVVNSNLSNTNVTATYGGTNSPVSNPICAGQTICYNIDIDDTDEFYESLNSLIGSTFSFGAGLPVLTYTAIYYDGHLPPRFFWLAPDGTHYNETINYPQSQTNLCYTYPSGTGNYTATLTQNDVCKITETVNLNFINSTATLNATTDCNNRSVSLTHTVYCSAGADIQWDFGDGTTQLTASSASGTTIINHTYLNNGIYTVTATVGGITVSKTVVIDQISIPTITGSLTACANETNGGEVYSASIADFFDPTRQYTYAWSVTGGTIDNTTPASGTFFPANQPINVKVNWATASPNLGGTVTLNVTSSNGCVYSKTIIVQPCCNQGKVITTTTKISELYPGTNSASNAIISVNAQLLIDNDFTCTNCKFVMGNSQTIEILPNVSGPAPTQLQLIQSNVFACDKMWDYILAPSDKAKIRVEKTFIEDGKNALQSKNGGDIEAINSTFNKNLHAIVISDYGIHPLEVRGCIFTCKDGVTAYTKPGSTLRAPYSANVGFAGIRATNVTQATIGDRTNVTYLNTFENTQHGIYSLNSNLRVYNNLFQEIVQPKGTKEKHIAIYSNGSSQVPTSLNIGGNLRRENNTFLNCDYGAIAENNNDLYIAYNSFNNIKFYAINYFKNTDKEDVKITNNSFTDVSVGVFAHDNLISTNLINNNSFIQSAHGAGIYAGEVAVLISEPSKSASAVYTINNNTIKWFAEGIHLSLVQGAKVNNNTIRLSQNQQEYGYGVYAEYNTGLTANNNSVVFMGGNAQPYYKGFYIATTTNSTYTCNSAEKLEDGFYFEENNIGTVLKTTSFSRNTNHLHISGNSGLIGEQGTPYISSSNKAKVNDNIFTPGFGNVNQTFTSNSAIGASSKFYVRSSPFQLNPTANNNDINSFYILKILYTNAQIAHPRLNCNVVLSPTGGLANGGNKVLARKIAKGLLNYPLQAAGNQQSKQNLLEAIKAEPSFAVGDTVLTQFTDSMQQSPWGQMTQALALMADSTQPFDSARVAQASSTIQAQNANTVMETNFKQVNQIWLQALQSGNGLDSIEQQNIRTIAWLCPITEGPAVYQARAIIHAYDSVYINYRNACEAYSAPIVYARGANLNEQETNEENVINNNIDEDAIYTQVFPTPSTTQVNVAVLSREQTEVTITLYTILGEQLQQQKVVTNSKAATFNTTNYPIGLYICKISDANGNLVENKKIFVTHE